MTTSHAYGACRNALAYVAERAGAQLVVAELPFPLAAEDELVEPILGSLNARTRLLVVDHVTSPSGLVLPVERIARAAAERGIPVLVDGAHGPGMVDVDLGKLADAGVGYYAANCHKWICAPKGSAFLWVRPDLQAGVHPTVISHGLASPRTDRTPLPARVRPGWPPLTRRPGSASRRRSSCSARCFPAAGRSSAPATARWRSSASDRLRGARRDLAVPEGLIGALATVPLEPASAVTEALIDPVAGELLAAFGIEIPVFPFPASPALRSAAERERRPTTRARSTPTWQRPSSSSTPPRAART